MKLLTIAITIFVLVPVNHPQEENSIRANDSIKININSLDNLLFQLDEFEFYMNLTEQKRSFGVNSETALLWLKTSLNIPDKSFLGSKSDLTPEYLHSSLYHQYLENSKFNPLRAALGMIQAGAAGYLAYRHIKKWVIKK